MTRVSGNRNVGIGRIGLAAVASVAISTAWYTAWGDRLGRLHPAYAGDTRPPAWVPPVELARSATVATGVAALAHRTGVAGTGEALALGAGLWTAFPLVMLSGSVVHEKVPWQLAAIHGGDWLLKLLAIAAVVGGGRRA